MKQLHDQVAFRPINTSQLTQQEKRKAMESLIFIAEKRDGAVKARTCANGSVQCSYISKEEAASPTVMTESILTTAAIEAHQERDVMSIDIPNTFIQTDVEKNDSDERIMMKIRGPLMNMLINIDPVTYGPYVYIEVLKALYRMLISSILFYKKLQKDLESKGFKINPYDPCIANRIIHGKQQMVTWHVNDLKSSHIDPKINDEFHQWLELKYGDPKINKVKAVRGKWHDYLAMNLDYSVPGEVKVNIVDYVKGMVRDFPEELSDKVTCPWNENLFKIDQNSPPLSKSKAEEFHTFIAKGLFVSKRAWQDIQPAIAFLTMRHLHRAIGSSSRE